jgi:hypothetical protein
LSDTAASTGGTENPVKFTRRAISLLMPSAATASASQALIPVLAAVLVRTTDAEAAISGFAVAFSIAILTGLPYVRVQQLTLVFLNDVNSLPTIRRFVLRWAGLSTLLIVIVAFTPLNSAILSGLFSVEPDVHQHAAAALRALAPFPGLLILRAHLHGVALRAEKPLVVWIGTFAGSAVVAVTVITLVGTDVLTGAVAGGIAFSTGAAIEVLLLLVLTRGVDFPGSGQRSVTIAEMTKFFWPLLVSALAPTLTQPVINAGMARAAEATVSIAAVSVAFGLFQTVSAATNGVQNAALALLALRFSEARVLRFMLAVGLSTTAATFVIGFVPPATDLVLGDILGTEGRLFELARFAFRLLSLLPVAMVLEQVYAARLMRARDTKPIVIINIARIIVLSTWVITTVNATSFTGAAVGAGAVSLTLLIEALMTTLYARRHRPRAT